jgi:Ser/Thr protein kinase RdoA (MazF antagonist)
MLFMYLFCVDGMDVHSDAADGCWTVGRWLGALQEICAGLPFSFEEQPTDDGFLHDREKKLDGNMMERTTIASLAGLRNLTARPTR